MTGMEEAQREHELERILHINDDEAPHDLDAQLLRLASRLDALNQQVETVRRLAGQRHQWPAQLWARPWLDVRTSRRPSQLYRSV